MTHFGPTGELVYNRTYSRTKPDGSYETWPDTVRRVVDGNLSMVNPKYHHEGEREDLIEAIESFDIIPAGRHLSASGVKGRQYLFNCHVAGWDSSIVDHFTFTFLRLMEGGGVGANYSNRYLDQYPEVRHSLHVHIVCDPGHRDYDKMREAGVLSSEYSSEWPGAYAVEDSREGWADALSDLLSTCYRPDVQHSARVYDVSRVRPEGEPLRTFGGTASGPHPFAVMMGQVSAIMNRVHDYADSKVTGMEAMEIDHEIAKCVVSGGNRRSARMSIMHWDDPQILRFLRCKQESGKHWTTNISVEVDSNFWDSMAYTPDSFASEVLHAISEGMLKNGEPGFWDSSLSNEGEPNKVVATNPCGEIALEPWENCNLGHVNLSNFVDTRGKLDRHALRKAHELITRFLIRATYGDVNDSKQAEKLARNRRIGVGHFGFASMLAKQGIRYSLSPEHAGVQNMLIDSARVVEQEAKNYAHEMRIPAPVKSRTVAPTGTIAKLPGASEGIHPIFSKYFIRRVRMSTINPREFSEAMQYASQGYHTEMDQNADNTVIIEIPTKDALLTEVAVRHGDSEAERIVEAADDLTMFDMLSVQSLYQRFWADNAVSYTVNIDPSSYTVSDVADRLAMFGGQLKGATVFPELSIPQSPYERITKEQYESFDARDISDGIDEECASGACPVV